MISTVIYLIGKILTFPGAYLKGFFEHLCGRMLGIPVEECSYLRLTDGCGHVEHDTVSGKAKNFFYAALPGLFTSIIGTSMFYAGVNALFILKIPFGQTTRLIFIVYCVLFYLGFSLLANCYPLMEDAMGLWSAIYGKDGANIVVKILLFIPCASIMIGSFLEKYALNVLILAGFSAAVALLI